MFLEATRTSVMARPTRQRRACFRCTPAQVPVPEIRLSSPTKMVNTVLVARPKKNRVRVTTPKRVRTLLTNSRWVYNKRVTDELVKVSAYISMRSSFPSSLASPRSPYCAPSCFRFRFFLILVHVESTFSSTTQVVTERTTMVTVTFRHG